MLSYFHRFSNFVWTGKNDSNMPRVDAFIFFAFGKRRKKSPFSNISGYMWPGPKLALKGLNRSIFKGEIFVENHWYTSFTKAFSLISTKV